MKPQQLSKDECIALGAVCGCGNCEYCHYWRVEQMLQRMDDEVRNGKRIAAEARERILKEMKEKKDEQVKR